MLSLLQASRFFAAIIVVLDHATITLGMGRYYDRTLAGGLFGAGRYGVDFFFVLSGFIICYAHWDDVGPGVPAAGPQGPGPRLARFARRRFVRIYPTYWVALLITLVPLYLTASRYEGDILSPTYLLSVVTLFQGNGNILTSAWTLTHEVLFYILFGLVIWRRPLGTAILGAWFALSALSYAIVPVSLLLAHPEHIGFLFGMVGCYLVRTARIPVPGTLFLIGLAGFATCCVLAGYVQVAPDLNRVVEDPAARGLLLPLFLFSTLMILGMVEMERSFGFSSPAVFRFLGDASYSIYLLHFPVVVVLVKLLHGARAERFLPYPVLFVLIVVVATLAGIVFHVAVERPLLALVNRWMGTRRQPAASRAQA